MGAGEGSLEKVRMSGSDFARLGGATLYADAGAVKVWAERNPPGAWLIYATGPALDPHHSTVLLVADLIRTGEAIPAKGRSSEGALQHRICRARPQAIDDQAGKKPRKLLKLDPEFAETAPGRILQLLSRCANLGLPCPTNRELADHAGLRDAEAARYQLGLLAKGGHLTARTGPSGSRVVTITATGRSTPERAAGDSVGGERGA